FGVVTVVAGNSRADIGSFKGLAKRKPILAIAFTVFLLAQAGVPFTSGFVAKFGVIQAAVSEDSYVLAVVAMVTAVIAAFLYLRIMVGMWLHDAGDDAPAVTIPFSAGVAIAIAAVFTIAVGLYPSPLIDLADSIRLVR
ncbi:MAG: proton-conducting transporter membrane subunit, partial [Ilumatobacter sp.]|uniref:proton-conducting transporter transmembrane domain-containing protein n=1 Tax=Ilumatobacter sp. TaxID=1967498 RepID=UPI003299F0A0